MFRSREIRSYSTYTRDRFVGPIDVFSKRVLFTLICCPLENALPGRFSRGPRRRLKYRRLEYVRECSTLAFVADGPAADPNARDGFPSIYSPGAGAPDAPSNPNETYKVRGLSRTVRAVIIGVVCSITNRIRDDRCDGRGDLCKVALYRVFCTGVTRSRLVCTCFAGRRGGFTPPRGSDVDVDCVSGHAKTTRWIVGAGVRITLLSVLCRPAESSTRGAAGRRSVVDFDAAVESSGQRVVRSFIVF